MHSYDHKGSSWAITGLVISGIGFIVALIANYNFEYGDPGLGVSIGYLTIGVGLLISLTSWGIMIINTLQDIRHTLDNLRRSVDLREDKSKNS